MCSYRCSAQHSSTFSGGTSLWTLTSLSRLPWQSYPPTIMIETQGTRLMRNSAPPKLLLNRIRHQTHPTLVRQAAVLQEQVDKSKNYSRLNHLVTKVTCPENIAIKSKAFFGLVTYIYSEGIQETSAEIKKQMALYGVVGMVVEGSLVVSVGGLHLLAWNVYFPSAIESLLWKGCSFGMILFPSIVVFIASFTRYERDLFPILWEVHFGGLTHRALLWFGMKHIHGICTRHARKASGSDVGSGRPLLTNIYYGLLFSCIMHSFIFVFFRSSASSLHDIHRGGILHQHAGSSAGSIQDPPVERLLASSLISCLTYPMRIFLHFVLL
jgi:hypothetical protein